MSLFDIITLKKVKTLFKNSTNTEYDYYVEFSYKPFIFFKAKSYACFVKFTTSQKLFAKSSDISFINCETGKEIVNFYILEPLEQQFKEELEKFDNIKTKNKIDEILKLLD